MPLELKEVGRVLSARTQARLVAAVAELSAVLALADASKDPTQAEHDAETAASEALGYGSFLHACDDECHAEDMREANDVSFSTIESAIRVALRALYPPTPTDMYPDSWPREVFDDYVIYSHANNLYKATYSLSDAGLATLGAPVRVVERKSYVVVKESGNLAESDLDEFVEVTDETSPSYELDGDEIDDILDAAEAVITDDELLISEEGDDEVDEAFIQGKGGLLHGSTKGGSKAGGGVRVGGTASAPKNTLAAKAGQKAGGSIRAMALAKMAHVKALLASGHKLSKTQLRRAIRARQTLRTGRVPSGAQVRARARRGGTAGLGTLAAIRHEAAADANLGGVVILSEASAVAADGRAQIKLISPGWGSSGYYSPQVLERDGPKVFKNGTQMFWDHPTADEEAARPERSLRDLAAKLTEDARWDAKGPKGKDGKFRGPGLYAEAQIFGPYRESVNELASHIGVSIRALGKASDGVAEGRKGRIVEGLVHAKSADFVTSPGRGGEVLQLFEAARDRAYAFAESSEQEGEDDDVSEAELKEARDRAETAETENAKLKAERLTERASSVVSKLVSVADLPALARETVTLRLSESIAHPPVSTDGTLDEATLTKTVETAIAAETAYILKLTGREPGKVRDMGGAEGNVSESAKDTKPDANQAALVEGFKRLGMTDKEAAIAAVGRN